MNSSLFAGLARKALQATAITPRLPSRYESLAVARAEAAAATAARTFDRDAAFSAAHNVPRPTLTPKSAPTPTPKSRPTDAGSDDWRAEPLTSPLSAPAPHAHPTIGDPASTADMASPSRSPAAPARGAAARAAAPASSTGWPAAQPAQTTAAHRLNPEAVPLTGGPSRAPREMPVQGLLSEPRRARATDSTPAAEGSVQALRERIARQLARLDDPLGFTRARAATRYGGDPAPDPSSSSAWSAALRANPAAPQVEITIGSIDIVLTTAPAAAPLRAAAQPAGPAVQSLDAYLQARQRRGGPRP